MRKLIIALLLSFVLVGNSLGGTGIGPGGGPPPSPGSSSSSSSGNGIGAGEVIAIILVAIVVKTIYDDYQENGCHPCRGGLGMFTGDENQVEILWRKPAPQNK